jgi:hypothetical protein
MNLYEELNQRAARVQELTEDYKESIRTSLYRAADVGAHSTGIYLDAEIPFEKLVAWLKEEGIEDVVQCSSGKISIRWFPPKEV